MLQVQNHWISFLQTQINGIRITSPRQARWLCTLLPSSCPFERTLTLGGRSFHSPALCKFNPLFPQLMLLRYRALTYLTEIGGEDITRFV